MANDYRNESRRQPPAGKYGTPGTQYPTANPYDVVITEEVTNRAHAFEPVLYGTPHPTVPAAVLCYQGQIKGNNTDKNPIRIYANPRLAQEPYNLVNGGSEANDPDFPVFVRSYLLPREYTRATPGLALTALIGLSLSAGGSGYGGALETPGFGKIALAFSGGGGTGAAGFAEVAAGVIVAVVLTDTGTGYTSAPTVIVSGGASADIAALLQPASAKLTEETEQPAEDPYGGFFVRVSRKWETLPGRAQEGVSMSGEAHGALVTTASQILAAGAAAYTPTWRTLSYSDVPLNAAQKKRTVTTLNDAAFPILTEYDQDPVLQYLIVTTYQIVEAAAVSAPTATNGMIKQFKRIDKWRSMKIVEDHTALLAKTYSEQRFDAASFPSLWDYTTYFVSDACGTFSTERDGFSTMVENRVDISFTATKQTIVGLTILPNSIHLGKAIQFTNILNDAGNLTYTGTCTGTVYFGASSPSRTAYLALVGGSPQLISGESSLFRAGIYRNTRLYRQLT